MTHPAVDVVLATYRRPSLTLQAVESVRRQSYPFWRLYVVDDGSGAASVEALRRGLGDDERTTLLTLEANVGAQGARQRCLPLLSGDAVALLDSDDLWAEGKLERQVSLLDESTDLVLCLHRWTELQSGTLAQAPGALREPVGLLDSNNMSTPLIRRRLLDEMGGFEPPGTPRLRTVDSVEFNLRLLSTARGIRVVQDQLVTCRTHGGHRNSDGLGSLRAAEELAEVLRLHADLLAAHPAEHAVLQGRLASRFAAAGERHRALKHLRTALHLAPSQRRRILRAHGPHLVRSLALASR